MSLIFLGYVIHGHTQICAGRSPTGRRYSLFWYSGAPDAARVLDSTGRMVALKSSGIWQALGDGEDFELLVALIYERQGYRVSRFRQLLDQDLMQMPPGLKVRPEKEFFNELILITGEDSITIN